MKAAFVTTNVLDMRAEPDHHAERVNQMLFGEQATVDGVQGGFSRVRRWDGYRGWVDSRFLAAISVRRMAQHRRKPAVTVISLQARLFGADTKSMAPHIVFYGTRLAVARRGRLWMEAELPDGHRVRMRTASVAPVTEGGEIRGGALVREARKFLGVPYLWGGISPAGLDCSGLVQTVYRRFGIELPRDTKEQIALGSLIDPARITVGDLMFFPGHVAIALSPDRIIHSSRGGGGVRIESLDPGNPEARLDLVNSFKEARRIV